MNDSQRRLKEISQYFTERLADADRTDEDEYLFAQRMAAMAVALTSSTPTERKVVEVGGMRICSSIVLNILEQERSKLSCHECGQFMGSNQKCRACD